MSLFRRIGQWLDGLGPPPVDDASLADTCASIVLCLRESGYQTEASAYEEMFVSSDDLDQLEFARLGFSFSEAEFEEKLFMPWLKAGGSQTAEHDDLKLSLVNRRRASLGTSGPR